LYCDCSSTIRGADKIVVVADGKVAEQGTHDDLITKPQGRYKRLFEYSKRDARSSASLGNSASGSNEDKKDEEDTNWEDKFEEEAALKIDKNRALKMAAPDVSYILLGAIGSIMVGSICELIVKTAIFIHITCISSSAMGTPLQ
jgi:ATP-binding cassette, subfamily B (MDR/TAP), member 1